MGGFHRKRDPQKWMVYIQENPVQMDDLGVPKFMDTPIYFIFFGHGRGRLHVLQAILSPCGPSVILPPQEFGGISLSHRLQKNTAPEFLPQYMAIAIDTTGDVTRIPLIPGPSKLEIQLETQAFWLQSSMGFNGPMDKRLVSPCLLNRLNIQLPAGPTIKQTAKTWH